MNPTTNTEPATNSQKSYAIIRMRKTRFWERCSKNQTDTELIAEIERRFDVNWTQLTKPQASHIIEALKKF